MPLKQGSPGASWSVPLNETDPIWVGAGLRAGTERVRSAAGCGAPADAALLLLVLFACVVTAAASFLEKHTFVWRQKNLQNWGLFEMFTLLPKLSLCYVRFFHPKRAILIFSSALFVLP